MKFALHRMPLNAQGYTSSGLYFGAGAPLYWACCEEMIDGKWPNGFTLRAANRAAAKQKVRVTYPSAKFHH